MSCSLGQLATAAGFSSSASKTFSGNSSTIGAIGIVESWTGLLVDETDYEAGVDSEAGELGGVVGVDTVAGDMLEAAINFLAATFIPAILRQMAL
jgi:hypothetical protein